MFKKKNTFINKFSVILGVFFASFGFISACVVTHALPYDQNYNSQIVSLDYMPSYSTNYRRVDYVTTDILNDDLFQVVLPLGYYVNASLEESGVLADIEVYCFPNDAPGFGDLTRDSQYYQGLIQLDCDANGDNMYTQVVVAVQVDHIYFNNTGYDIVLYVSNHNQLYLYTPNDTFNSGTQIYVDYSTTSIIRTSYENGYNNGLNQGISQATEEVQNAYTNGVTDGYNRGYLQGKEDGYNNGFDRGVSSVNIAQIANEAYSRGVASVDTQTFYDEGYNRGLTESASASTDLAYRLGYTDGYTKGRAEVPSNSTLNGQTLIWTIASTPFETFKTILNFDILGVNLAGFVLGLFTIGIIIWIIKKII